MASVRDKNLEWTAEAQEMDRESDRILTPLFQKIVNNGFSHAEASYIIYGALRTVELRSVFQYKKELK